MTKLRVLGVDGCKDGWVAIELHDGAFAGAHIAATLPALLAERADVDVVGLDMPLGLAEAGWRQADVAAAAALGAARSTVFRVPPRPVWLEEEYEPAVKRCREITGQGFSRQAWALRNKLLEANAYRNIAPHRLFEVHPEVSFRGIAQGRSLPSKKTWQGQMQRRDLLLEVGIALPAELGAAGRAGPDDVLDAAAGAWSAHRIATGQATSYPDPAEACAAGGTIAIWC
ncbi:DUF429 domain-containing protein [Micromonospora sp. 4G57]|uniref:DUF429 domain-containing protein n=1 Tax=Micromonospora sicca TaxID=2202420 RepID=A0ABU5JP19_9ACTN|nr:MULTISPECIES: DUF429 domain-containing protein [unclassified Micromonospora]MDZ5447591.1 DUF429 domain-containing protein [Micromonospora sp. 4G57]MDZ5494331.1 DUF429 domain-containing protein [Micromonospora sp. 4G53]